MDQSSFDRIARLLASGTTRRAGIGAALAVGATDALASASDRAEARRKRDERRDRRRAGRAADAPAKDQPAAGEQPPSDRGSGGDTAARPATGPAPQGPCGDGGKADNTCSVNIDCCTNYCVGKRCRCKSRGMACSSRKECCRGLVCTAGACTEPAPGPTGPGPAPTGPTGPGATPSGPTGALIYNQGGAFGATSTLFYDYANSGFVGIGTPGPTGALHVANPQASSPAFVVQAASGQTGPVSLWQDGSGAEMFRLTADSLGNLFLGKEAGGASITNADNNTAIGKSALKSVTSGYNNIALGNSTLENLTTGNGNVAIGYYALNAGVDADQNIAIGRDAGYSLTSGSGNIIVGYEGLYSATTAASNVAIGKQAGYSSETALNNVFVGENAGNGCVDGESNTYIGYYAGDGDSYGSFNTYLGAESGGTSDGDYNIAIGYGAWVASDTGSKQLSIGNLIYGTGLDGYEGAASTGNIGIGITGPAARLHVAGTGPTGPVQIFQGAQGNTGPMAYFWSFDGSERARITIPHKDSIFIGYQTNLANSGTPSNTALGSETLKSQTTGYENTAIGYQAAKNMTTGDHNTVMGAFAHKGGTGSQNTAVGSIALLNNTSGDNNTAIGSGAINTGESGSNNTAVGYSALVRGTGSQMTALGKDALNPTLSGSNRLTYNNVTGLGFNAQVTGSDQVQLGDTNVTVYAQSALQTRSDRRDKTDIRDTVLGLAFIEAIRPVDYRWDMRDDYRIPGPSLLMPDASDEERAAHEAATEAAARTWDFSSIVPDGTHRRSRFHHGVIAQDVRDVMERLGVDFGGFQDHSINGGQDVLSVGYSEFIAPLIRAVQELSQQNRELVVRIEGLEAARQS